MPAIDLHSYDSYDTHDEPTLPPLPPLPTPIPPPNATPLRLQPPGPMLPVTTSMLFTKLLYSRLILDSNPPILKITCLQPNCGYLLSPSTIRYLLCLRDWGQLQECIDSNDELQMMSMQTKDSGDYGFATCGN